MRRILIPGVNGFIGHHLSRRILESTDWEIYGFASSTTPTASRPAGSTISAIPDALRHIFDAYRSHVADARALVE
jgi:nucleoside-diphosphate-sugar epimerase